MAADWISETAVRSGDFRRPRMEIVEAPAIAKLMAIDFPIPVPPPVIMTFFPDAQREGSRGEIAG